MPDGSGWRRTSNRGSAFRGSFFRAGSPATARQFELRKRAFFSALWVPFARPDPVRKTTFLAPEKRGQFELRKRCGINDFQRILEVKKVWYPQRDSNPCRRLERAVS